MRAATLTAILTLVPIFVAPCATYGGGPARVQRAIDPSLVLVSSLDAEDELLSIDRGQGGASEDRHGSAQMFLLSLAVPGSGQLVQGQTRGFAYLAAEAAFWTGFFILNGEGLDKRDEYEAFADDHWDYDAYVAFFAENCADTCEMCPEIGCRRLAPRGSQEFYEDIGKYEVYWEYWRPASDWQAVRDLYWQMRKDSNRDLRNARYFVTAAFLNHLVSAVDSFLSTRGGRSSDNSGRDLTLEFDAPDSGQGLSCAVVMRY